MVVTQGSETDDFTAGAIIAILLVIVAVTMRYRFRGCRSEQRFVAEVDCGLDGDDIS